MAGTFYSAVQNLEFEPFGPVFISTFAAHFGQLPAYAVRVLLRYMRV